MSMINASPNGYILPTSRGTTPSQSRSSSFKNTITTVSEHASFNVTPASTPSRTSFSTTSSPILEADDSMPYSSRSNEDLTPEPLELSLPLASPQLNMPDTPPVSQPTSPPLPQQPKVMPETSTLMKGGATLIRRFSRGASSASNKLRGRPSSASLRRDQHQGSVVRRRSDSRSMIDGNYDVSEVELDPEEDEYPLRDPFDLTAQSGGSKPPTPSRRSSDRRFMAPPPLPETTLFVRRSKKGSKQLQLSLDESRCKITWTATYGDPKIPDRRKQVYLDDIKSLRWGPADAIGELSLTDDEVERFITIVYFDKKQKFMHLIAPSQQQRDVWVSAIDYLRDTRATNMSGVMECNETTLKEHWRKEMAAKYFADSLTEQGMDFDMILRTCRSFHINKSKQGLQQMFRALDVEARGIFDFKQYLEFFRQLSNGSVLRTLFHKLTCNAHGVLTLGAFMIFLEKEQRVNVSAEFAQWEAIFNRRKDVIRAEDDEEEQSGMSFEAFRTFLNSWDNSILVKLPKQRLDKPLNQYFISSSHNTYLMGRQFNGQSSVEGYIEALNRGCRCIEIDCWDGPDGKPIVTHGRTLTSSVPFLDCIKVVNERAFVASEYPLIISLEVHCSNAQQERMAHIMKQTFGSKLVLEPLPTHRYILPSPEDLKGRILIKVKRPKNSGLLSPPENPVVHRRMRSASAPVPHTSSFDERFNQSPTQPLLVPAVTAMVAPDSIPQIGLQSPDMPSASDSDDGEFEDVPPDFSPLVLQKQRTSNIVPILGEMGVYTCGIRFSGWDSPDSKEFNHIYSFKESTFDQRSETAEMKALMQEHNTRYLMRVYPKFSRISSSNFDPIRFWRRGVQMVATNWQTRDVPSEIMDAMFAAEGDRSGYVLKPKELRSYPKTTTVTPSLQPRQHFKLPKKQVKFSVKIISAQHLGMNSGTIIPENPYVEFEVYSAEDKSKDIATGIGGTDASKRTGYSGLGAPLRKRTNIIPGNGYDPVWDQTIEMTLNTKYPSLVFVRFAVHHSSDGRSANSKTPVAMYTAKLSALAQGYRYIPLQNRNGEQTISKLLCYITKEEPQVIEEPVAVGDVVDPLRSSEDGPRKRDRMLGLLRTFSGRRVRPSEKSAIEKEINLQ